MVIFECDNDERIVFHFNKASITNSDLPAWVIKHKGLTYYVNHVISRLGFETKETPESEHTKGSIQFKASLRIEKMSSGEILANIY